jgi:hypothetical protein
MNTRPDIATTSDSTLVPRQIGGWSLIAAAPLFWLAWFLMPEPGTVDAAFILRSIAAQRSEVLLSAILQTLCAVALVPAVLSVAAAPGTLIRVGALLTLIGALGNAADAVYHQMAYEMTALNVDRAAMLPVMTRMQTSQIWLLVPLLLSFFPGAACLCIGLAREGRAPRRVWPLFAFALGLGLAGVAAARTLGIRPRLFSLAALGLFSLALGVTGWYMRRSDGF